MHINAHSSLIDYIILDSHKDSEDVVEKAKRHLMRSNSLLFWLSLLGMQKLNFQTFTIEFR